MGDQHIEYVYVDEVQSGNELDLRMDGDRLYVVGPDGKLVDAQLVESNEEEYYVDEDGNQVETAVIEENTEEQEEIIEFGAYMPDGVEVVETTDSVGGDMKFVMVNQQEVLVVRNNHSPNKPLNQKRRIPIVHQENRVMKRRRVTPQSVKKGPKLIQDFLLPHLDNETFGHLLRWIDRDIGKFAMNWAHKNGADWRAEDCAVFREWDRIKERDFQDDPRYWMEAKQRFRAALAKVSTPSTSNREDLKTSRIFQIKWTRETRMDLLDRIYTSSKYFDLPPKHSFGRRDYVEQDSHEKFYVDNDFTQEVVVGAQEDTMSADGRDEREESHLEPLDLIESEVVVEELIE